MVQQKEKGIALVALIITIIVLIILAAVIIKAVFDSNFIGIAIKGTENYTEWQVKEEMMDNTAEYIGEAASNIVSAGQGGEGRKPIIPEQPGESPKISDVEVLETHSNSFTVKFKATHNENAQITYKLTWGTDEDYQIYNSTEYSILDDGYVSMIANNLTKITTYTFKAYAYNTLNTDEFGSSEYQIVKTLCDGRGKNCTGFKTCDKCLGKGKCTHSDSSFRPIKLTTYAMLKYGNNVNHIWSYNKIQCNKCNASAYAVGPGVDSTTRYWYVGSRTNLWRKNV